MTDQNAARSEADPLGYREMLDACTFQRHRLVREREMAVGGLLRCIHALLDVINPGELTESVTRSGALDPADAEAVADFRRRLTVCAAAEALQAALSDFYAAEAPRAA